MSVEPDYRRHFHQVVAWLNHARTKMQEIAAYAPATAQGRIAATWLADFEVDVATLADRETGASIPPGVCPECQQSPCIGHPHPPDPPALNKRGGDWVCKCGCSNDAAIRFDCFNCGAPASASVKRGGEL